MYFTKFVYKILAISITIIAIITFNIESVFSEDSINLDSLKYELKNSNEDSNKANLLNNLSWQLKDVNYSESKKYADQALNQSIEIDYIKGQAEAYLNIGYYFQRLHDNKNAFDSYQKVLEIAESEKDQFLKVRVYNKFYLMYKQVGDIETAVGYAFKALEISERINYQAAIAATYINLGVLYLDQSANNKAKDYFDKSLKIAKKIKHRKKIGLSYLNLGVLAQREEKYNVALNYYNQALEIYKDLNNRQTLITIYGNIGDIYALKGKHDKALKNFMLLVSISRELKDSVKLSHAYFKLAYFFKDINQHDSSFHYAERSYIIAESKNSLHGLKNSTLLLYNIYQDKKDYKNALHFLELNKAISDSLFSYENITKINKLESQHVLSKYEKEIKLMEMERGIYRLKTTILISFIVFIAIIIIQILNRRRVKNKKDKEIYLLKFSKAEAELEKRKAELKTLSFEIIEKNKDIEDLLGEIEQLENTENKNNLSEKKEELSKLRILTEDDWLKFKNLFEDIYSDFPEHLETIDSKLSDGDKRQLMLIRLGFSINHSAEILGVGYKAVQKARQRLAQKLDVESAKDIHTIFNTK